MNLKRLTFHVSDLDGEAEDLDAHPANIGRCHFPHKCGKLISILVNLLNS